jgi:hypothetical protein
VCLIEIGKLVEVSEFKVTSTTDSLSDCFVICEDSGVTRDVILREFLMEVGTISIEFLLSMRESEGHCLVEESVGDIPVL